MKTISVKIITKLMLPTHEKEKTQILNVGKGVRNEVLQQAHITNTILV